MTPEKKVQNSIMEYLKSQNIYCERRQASGVGSKKGLPDLWCVYKKMHIEIEVKAPGGEPSNMQLKRAMIFSTQDVLHIFVYSVEDLKNYLNKL